MDNKHIAILVIVGVIVVGIIIGVSSSVTGKAASSHYSCDWDWWGGAGEGGQGIMYDRVRYHDCTYPEPYCKPAATMGSRPQCCKWSAAAGHYDCEDAPLSPEAETSDCSTCCCFNALLYDGDAYTFCETHTIKLIRASDTSAVLKLDVVERDVNRGFYLSSSGFAVELKRSGSASGAEPGYALVQVCPYVL